MADFKNFVANFILRILLHDFLIFKNSYSWLIYSNNKKIILCVKSFSDWLN